MTSPDGECRYRVSSVGRRGVLLLDGAGCECSALLAGGLYRDGAGPVPGDRVLVADRGGRLMVEDILPRKGVLQRTSPTGQSQIIAANVDRVLAVVALVEPELRPGFLDRILAAAEWRSLESSIVVNKIDLASRREDRELLETVERDYGPGGAGYPVFPVSSRTGAGMDEFMAHIRGMTVVMAGPSGAGKTSLAMHFNPGLELRIGVVNLKTSKGRHTTVSARMVPLAGETSLIDTPGLRMFSIEHIPPEDLKRCFPEFRRVEGDCHFRDCMHVSEPGCAVTRACEEGTVPASRLAAYRAFVEETKGQRSGS